MALGVVKVNPAHTVTSTNLQGASLQFFTVGYVGTTGSQELALADGPYDAQQAVLKTIEQTATLSYVGPLFNVGGFNGSTTGQSFAVESLGGSGAVDTTALQVAIRALGYVGSNTPVDLSAATVTAKTFKLA